MDRISLKRKPDWIFLFLGYVGHRYFIPALWVLHGSRAVCNCKQYVSQCAIQDYYIRSEINYVVREDLNSKLLEILSVEIHRPNSKPFVVTWWYRPPNSPVDLFSNIDSLLGRLDSENIEHYLMHGRHEL